MIPQTSNEPLTVQRPTDPEFSDTDADVVLVSSDDIGFRMHSFVLKTASPVFAGMLSMSHPDDVPLSDPSTKLRPLFRLMTAKGIPNDLDGLESLLVLADKYDMAGITAIVNQLLIASGKTFLDTHALRVYDISYRFDMTIVKKTAFEHLLDVDIQQECHLAALEQMDPPSFRELVKLRIRRRNAVDERISSVLEADPDGWLLNCPFDAAHRTKPHSCTSELIRFTRGLRAAVYRELDRRPSGKGLKDTSFLESQYLNGSEQFYQCQQYHPIGVYLLTRSDVLKRITDYLDSLPLPY